MRAPSNDTPEGRAQNRRVEIDTVPDDSLAAESRQETAPRRQAPAAEEPR